MSHDNSNLTLSLYPSICVKFPSGVPLNLLFKSETLRFVFGLVQTAYSKYESRRKKSAVCLLILFPPTRSVHQMFFSLMRRSEKKSRLLVRDIFTYCLVCHQILRRMICLCDWFHRVWAARRWVCRHYRPVRDCAGSHVRRLRGHACYRNRH